MNLRSSVALAAMLLLLGSPAVAGADSSKQAPAANTAPAKPTANAAPAKPPATFETLSAGDRKIARALFLAQHPTPSGPAPLSLNQIAELKAGNSWARVFKQMQSGGLVQAKTLGQVVEGYEHQRRSDRRSNAKSANRDKGAVGSQVLVTNGQGFIVASSRNKGAGALHGGDEVAERGGTALQSALEVPARKGQ
jgi:hypothetical protein